MKSFRYAKDHLDLEDYEFFFEDRKKNPWPVAMERLLSRPNLIKPHKIQNFLKNKDRNDFVYLLPIPKNSKVLDFGSGWGNTSFTLSDFSGQVISMEADYQRLHFSADHMRHAGNNNVFPVCSSSKNGLPFADEVFDVVIMNGVLEWTATAVPGKPSNVHKDVLGEIKRVLKPGGTLVVSIENRYSYKWFLGVRDHHAGGLRWASVLPRWMASLYSLVRLGRPYRTWFYSLPHLKKLLSDVGYEKMELYSYFPTHVAFKRMFRLDSDSNAQLTIKDILKTSRIRSWKDRVAYRLVAAGVPYRWFAHDFFFTIQKPNIDFDNVSSFIGEIRKFYDATSNIVINLRSKKRSVILEAAVDGKPTSVQKISREITWNNSVVRETEMLSLIEKLGEYRDIQVPKLLNSGCIFDRQWVLMEFVKGSQVTEVLKQDNLQQRIVAWLSWLGSESNVKYIDDGLINTHWDFMRETLPDISYPAAPKGLYSKYQVAIHGDLSPKNILVSGNDVAVIDWEFGAPEGFPLVDLIDFLLYLHFQQTRDYQVAWKALFDAPENDPFKMYIQSYCDVLSLQKEHIAFLSLMFLCRKISLLSNLPDGVSQKKRRDLVEIFQNQLDLFKNTYNE